MLQLKLVFVEWTCFSKLVHGVIAADITVQHLMTFLYNTALRVGQFTDSAWIIMDDKG